MRKTIIILSLLISFPFILSSQPKQEIRATWLTTFGGLDWPHIKAHSPSTVELQKKELCEILDSLKKININTVLLQTRVRGDVIYPSKIETFTESITGHEGGRPGYDPLAFAIEECHKRGMQLHAWIVTIPVGNLRQVKILGKSSIVQKNKSLCKLHEGNWYLDPGNPRTKDYLSSIVTEIVKNYDVDGVHFDYIRYPENASAFNDKDTYRRYGSGKSLSEWRRNNITAIVSTLYHDVKALKPWVIVSSSPVGKYNNTARYTSKGWNAYQAVFQDAQKWLKDGIHDALFPMMYFRDNNFYPFALDWKENNNNRWIAPGLGIYFLSPKEKNWPIEEVSRQIFFTRKHNLNGQAFFRTKFLLDNVKGLYDELYSSFYTTPALLPAMTWIDSIPPTTPANGGIKVDGDNIIISWNSSKDNSNIPVKYNLYGSNSYPVDVSSAKNLIHTYINSTNDTLCFNKGEHFSVYYAITAIDRYGNESTPLSINSKSDFEINFLNCDNTIKFSGKDPYKKILIYTVTNQVVSEKEYSPQIDISGLERGLYFVRALQNNGEIKPLGNIVVK